MLHRYKQIVFKIFISGVFLFGIQMFGKDIPIMKTVTVNIPAEEYSIIDFPFEIKDLQAKTFNYGATVVKQVPEGNTAISLSRRSNNIENAEVLSAQKGNDVLGLEQGVNVLTFKPKFLGSAEMIIWGYEQFPIIMKINVVDAKDATDKQIRFIETIDNDKDIANFESSSHEKIIEEITRHLYDDSYKSKPAGYESVVQSKSYKIQVLDDDRYVVGNIENSLLREIVGRDYLGQVWNINYVPNDDNSVLKIRLYEEMFDGDGVFSVSVESYLIDTQHGTRVMIVRRRL